MELTKEYFEEHLDKVLGEFKSEVSTEFTEIRSEVKNFTIKDDLEAMEERLDTKFTTKKDLEAFEGRLDTKFATKDDLVAMEGRLDTKFATKDDLKSFATKDDLTAQTTELKQYVKEQVEDQTEVLAQIIQVSVAEPLERHLRESGHGPHQTMRKHFA